MWPGATMTRPRHCRRADANVGTVDRLTGGRIETHFHVFGSLVILSFYRDWRVLIPATIVVTLDHFVRGIYWPYSVYGVLTAVRSDRFEHAGWVIFEDVFLVISCLRSIVRDAFDRESNSGSRGERAGVSPDLRRCAHRDGCGWLG